MKQETNTLDGIHDIALPLAPVDSGWGIYTIMLMMIVLGGILIGIGYRWWKTPRQRCRRKLGKLLHQHKDGQLNSHEAVFRLAEILRERLHSHQLSSEADLPAHLQYCQSRWYEFINELDAARYSCEALEEAVFDRLANEARFWLGRW
jgi:hypothetical protein